MIYWSNCQESVDAREQRKGGVGYWRSMMGPLSKPGLENSKTLWFPHKSGFAAMHSIIPCDS